MKPSLEGLLNQARHALSAGESRKGLELCQRTLALRPAPQKAAEALVIAGQCLEILLADSDAYQAYRQAVNLDPQSSEANLALGKLLLAHGDPARALPALQTAIELRPNEASWRVILAQAYLSIQQESQAEVQLRSALELNSNLSDAHAMLGYRLQTLGRFDDARHHFRRSIQIQPLQAVSYYGIVQGRKVTDEDGDLVSQMQIASESPNLAESDRMYLLYSLGKASSDLGEFRQAMEFWNSANQVARKVCLGGRPFANEQYRADINRTIETFTRDFFQSHRSVGSASAQPIFIVGMMRSGTTLMDQILSSHPEVGAMGERPFWLTQPLNLERASPVQESFLKMQVEAAGSMPRITDKTPQNFQVLGWIHLLFPHAKIVHMTRDPIDNCLSIYSTPYEQSPDFAHDLSSIAFAYQTYRRLMQHWHSVIPEESILQVSYEELVSNHAETVERVVRFCGLEWDSHCLEHQSNRAVVKTPSMWQVRQPIYSGSVGKWRSFEPWLGELLNLS